MVVVGSRICFLFVCFRPTVTWDDGSQTYDDIQQLWLTARVAMEMYHAFTSFLLTGHYVNSAYLDVGVLRGLGESLRYDYNQPLYQDHLNKYER